VPNGGIASADWQGVGGDRLCGRNIRGGNRAWNCLKLFLPMQENSLQTTPN
jgi:hypothetical protein